MNRLIPPTLACCLLTACAFGPKPTPEAPIKVPPPASLTAPPQVLPPPRSGAMRDLEANHLQVALAYHRLAARYCALLAWLEVKPDDGCQPFLQP